MVRLRYELPAERRVRQPHVIKGSRRRRVRQIFRFYGRVAIKEGRMGARFKRIKGRGLIVFH